MTSLELQTAPTTGALVVLDQIPDASIAAAIAHLAARAMAAPVPNAATRAAPETDDLLTIKEAGRLLKLGRNAMYRHARELGAVRVGRQLRLPKKKLLSRIGR